jgi:hypothetical protein
MSLKHRFKLNETIWINLESKKLEIIWMEYMKESSNLHRSQKRQRKTRFVMDNEAGSCSSVGKEINQHHIVIWGGESWQWHAMV